MKILSTATMVATIFFAMSLKAQQASDGVTPEAEVSLAADFEAISSEVEDSLAAKADGKPILAKNWMVFELKYFGILVSFSFPCSPNILVKSLLR